jgi:hypothetical protein
MSIEFINKLVRYYDIGCNCVGGNAAYGSGLGYGSYPGYGGYPGYAAPAYGASPFAFGNLPLNPTFGTYPKGEKRNTNHTLSSTIKIVDNIVQLPHDLNIQFEKPPPPPPQQSPPSSPPSSQSSQNTASSIEAEE